MNFSVKKAANMFTYIQEVVKKRRIFIDNQLLDLKMMNIN